MGKAGLVRAHGTDGPAGADGTQGAAWPAGPHGSAWSRRSSGTCWQARAPRPKRQAGASGLTRRAGAGWPAGSAGDSWCRRTAGPSRHSRAAGQHRPRKHQARAAGQTRCGGRPWPHRHHGAGWLTRPSGTAPQAVSWMSSRSDVSLCRDNKLKPSTVSNLSAPPRDNTLKQSRHYAETVRTPSVALESWLCLYDAYHTRVGPGKCGNRQRHRATSSSNKCTFIAPCKTCAVSLLRQRRSVRSRWQ